MDYIYFDVTWDMDAYAGDTKFDLKFEEPMIVPVINSVPFSRVIEGIAGWDKKPGTMFLELTGCHRDISLYPDSPYPEYRSILDGSNAATTPRDVTFTLVDNGITIRFGKFETLDSYAENLARANLNYTFGRSAYMLELENLEIRIKDWAKTLALLDPEFHYA